MPAAPKPANFKDREWRISYKTSSATPGRRAVNILHDFYIPVLTSSVDYKRVAGYFSSSSLAVASQGFSALVNSGGKIRLVVGSDLKEDDVEAILKGDSQRMAEALNSELDRQESWPKAVTRGVALLSWMVAKGYLDIRVAFRVHKNTGKALPFSSSEDGYVHEKWAVFTDQKGDRIYISGSLNESRTALLSNAENIDVHADWWGKTDRRRVDEAQADFENIWNDMSAYLRVMTLPQAVKDKMITIAASAGTLTEIDGTRVDMPESMDLTAAVPRPTALELLRFRLIKDGPKLPRGRYVGMETAPVKAWPHQDVVARRIIETWPYSYLLCDEVGLGKTIEAGLVFRSLYLSGIAKRILITPPAGLTQQWQREMASKFLLPFSRSLSGPYARQEVIYPTEKSTPLNSLFDPDLSIVSTGLISRAERRHEIKAAKPFDITFVDEAHYARRKNAGNGHRVQGRFGNLYETIRTHLRQKSKSLLLATATPMQIDWIEVFDLIHLTLRVGQFQEDPSLTWTYYDMLGAIVRGEETPNDLWDFLKHAITALDHHDPFYKGYLDNAVIDGRIKSTTRQWLERNRIPRGLDRKRIQRLIFSAAPLSRVMLRHTRPLLEIYREKGQLGANLAKRHILPVPKIVLNDLEKTAYDELDVYCRELVSRLASNKQGNKARPSLGFLLSFLRLRLASSLFAIKETLKRRREKVTATLSHMAPQAEDQNIPSDIESCIDSNDESDKNIQELFLKDRTPADLTWELSKLTDMLGTLRDLSAPPSKFQALLNVLDRRKFSGNRIQQLVIFTRFYDTLSDIVTRLRAIDPGMRIGTYSGKGGQYVDPDTRQMNTVDREEIKHRFMGESIDVLVCTDAAAEGLNLQTADLIINYDLPWNPMKVEQRIGRIDRIGQKHDDIYVLNLCYVDSAEQIVYDRLLKRLVQAGDIVGTQQVSMLPVSVEEFNDLAAGDITPQELEASAKERIKEQNNRRQSMEIPARELYEIYLRLTQTREKNSVPITLDNIWQAFTEADFLKRIGCRMIKETANTILEFSGLDEFPEGACLTTDRKSFEQGGRELNGPLHFGSYGDPVFDAVINTYQAFELPPAIQRISETIQDMDTEVVGYAVAVKRQGKATSVKLVARWSDLKNIEIDEKADLSQMDLAPVKKQLHSLVRKEYDPTRAVGLLEQLNFKAATAQRIMNLICIKGLLLPIGSTEDENFWTITKGIEELLAQRDRLMVSKLPVKILEKIHPYLLTEIQVPKTGEYTTLTLAIHFIAAALDEGYRVADAMRVKKSELTVGAVRSRIDREVKKIVEQFLHNA
ncbi:helicase-related protein [Desulfobacter latus]|uniref:Helicase n=1 Tax=Desulfobacter latus TaxID=2292 RepID=A0A850SZB8_9BACT|nr:helicase-related protein [Desulfobacter latus]NWH06599.1 helicase [Desulfobacter latus]